MHAISRGLLILCCLLGVVHVARADPRRKLISDEARRHLKQGNKLYNIRSFDQAIEEYKAGALVEEVPVFDYNLGQCFRQLGKYKEAIWHYERFLSRGDPQGEVLDAVNGFLAQMKSELEKKAMTQSPVEPAPTGLPQGSAPTPPVRVPTPPVRTSAPVLSTSTTAEAWYADRFGWAITATGVAGLAVSSGLLIDARSLDNEAKVSHGAQEHHQLQDKASTRSLLGSVAGVAGASLLVTGIIKLAVYPRTRSQVATWNIGGSGNSVMVFGRF